MKSITGVEINNPEICIKGNANFACVCEDCMQYAQERMQEFIETLDKEIKKKKD